MKNLLMILILFSSCSNGRGLIKGKKNLLVLNEAYSQQTSGGKESVNNTHSSNNYVFAFNEIKDIEVNAVWIDKKAYKFETFNYEGQFFISVQDFIDNSVNEIDMKAPMSTKAKALIMYRKNNETHYLEVFDIEERDAVKAK